MRALRIILPSLLAIILASSFSWIPWPVQQENIGFGHGEKLVYRVHYSIFNAGEAIITIDDKMHQISERDCYRINVHGRSVGAFDMILRIRDTWRSYMDEETLLPQKFYRSIQEGKYIIRETTFFDHQKKSVRVVRRNKEGELDRDKNYKIGDNSFDIVSGIYAIRAMDFSMLYEGYKFPMTAFFEDSTYTLEIKYLGTKRIRTKFGKMNTHVFTPLMPGNQMFEDGENTITVYFTDTPAKVPVKIRAEMFVGAVECDLKDYSNVKGSLN